MLEVKTAKHPRKFNTVPVRRIAGYLPPEPKRHMTLPMADMLKLGPPSEALASARENIASLSFVLVLTLGYAKSNAEEIGTNLPYYDETIHWWAIVIANLAYAIMLFGVLMCINMNIVCDALSLSLPPSLSLCVYVCVCVWM